MSQITQRLRNRQKAKADLATLLDHPNDVVIVHYSCESFYDRPDGSSPRITSVAVRNFGSGQTVSFSIHQIAEREKKSNHQELEANYDSLEKKMLKDFYDYVEHHKNSKWLHWNMRDINYGFAALAHRYRVLGGRPFELPESQLHDLARILVGLYGVGYIGHPRLTKLIEKNHITSKDFLSGADEAAAFQNGQYVKLHQSTLRKVDCLANLVERLASGKLRTDATMQEIYGSYPAYVFELARDHWIVVLLGLIGAIASIVSLLRH